MSTRVCPCLGCTAHPGSCPTLTAGGRCQLCATAIDRARGTARQRGYDTAHDKLRRRLLPKAIGTPCPRCGEPMVRGQALDLGHTIDRAIDPTSRADRIEHADCNRRAGGQLGHSNPGG